MADPVFVTVCGERHAVVIPNDFAMLEELVSAYLAAKEKRGVTLMRAYSAILGLCTRLGKRAGADYAQERFDALAYGGKVYAQLRRGFPELVKSEAHPTGKILPTKALATIPEIIAATDTVYGQLVQAMYPREEEVIDAMGKSPESAAH